MFSMTTMELSTSIPIPSANPDSDIIFKEIPEKYINTRAVSTDNGMLTATTMVGFTSFKNSARTTIASAAPTTILWTTPLMIIVI